MLVGPITNIIGCYQLPSLLVGKVEIFRSEIFCSSTFVRQLDSKLILKRAIRMCIVPIYEVGNLT